MAISTTTKFKILHLFTHVCALFGIGWAIYTGSYAWLLASFLIFLYAGIVGVDIALHRYFSHRSFKTGNIRDWLLLISSFLPMLGSTVAWCSIHRYHHVTSDTDKDPHSPKTAGKLGAWFAFWPKVQIPLSLVKRLSTDKRAAFLHKNYFNLVMLYVLVLFLINPLLVPFVFALPAVGCFHGAAAISVIPHLTNFGGYRTYETSDNSRNHWLAWILSLGEGWHNNHHNNPSKWRTGEKWWELDPPAFVIKHFFKID